MSSPHEVAANPPAPNRVAPSHRSGFRTVVVLCLAVLAVYCPLPLLDGSHTLVGMDFSQLHTHRIRYAQQALFSAQPHLPGWHSRELLGSPFWSNTQNFPFIPTRLVLLLCDPYFGFAVGVNLAAILAAVFTYLYARRIGLGLVPASVAGWTFACSGFFASRVMAGHLPLLEAYPTLPLLLWLIERYLQGPPGDPRAPLKLLSLGLASTCTVLAGHPQLPIYALSASFLYLLFRGRHRTVWRAGGAMICGAGIAAFALYPMFLLIQRSTRVLRLDEPGNNIYFPYGRLLAFLFPWKDGAAPGVHPSASEAFHGYPNMAFFWDTVCYVGWLPILAVVFLLLRWGTQRTTPARPWLCVAIGGTLALLLALPFMQQVLSWIPGTILRSPSRQIYLTTFSLSLAVGAAAQLLMPAGSVRRPSWAWAAFGLGLLIHGADLGAHARHFIQTTPVPTKIQRVIDPRILAHVGDGRVAIDYVLSIPWNRDIDDIGFFDSIMLAKPYQALLAMNGAPPGLNIQEASGVAFNLRSLAYAGVRLMITTTKRGDLPAIATEGPVLLYSVPDAQPRVQFLPQRAARFLGQDEILARLRNQNNDLKQTIMFFPNERLAARPSLDRPPAASVQYRRESEDDLVITVQTDQPGYVRILEAWDPGWKAWVNGNATDVLCADSAAIAVPVDPASRELRLHFSPPGTRTGGVMALMSLGALLLLARLSRDPLR